MDLEQLITNYGYIAVIIGTFFEGETILVVAGFLSQRDYLELPYVIASAFIGTLLGDQLYFYIGHFKGKKFIDKRPHWQPKITYINTILDKHQTLLILGFRFVYGIRTIIPFVLGSSGISPVRFFVLNVCGALIWAIAVGVLGYYFGHALELVIDEIKQYEKSAMVGLLLVGALVWLIYWKRSKAIPLKANPKAG